MKNNIKRITTIVLLLAVMFSLSACSSASSVATEKDTVKANGLVKVSNQHVAGKDLYIMYDPDTLVVYALTAGSGIHSVLQIFPLYNADGTLKTYTPSTESD